MISEAIFWRIKRLLSADEFSRREIARECGVSKATVDAYALLTAPPRRIGRPSVGRPWGSAANNGPRVRCPECGCKVFQSSLRESGLCVGCDMEQQSAAELKRLAANERISETLAARRDNGPKSGPEIHGLATPIDNRPPRPS